jgi:hypothetical protein
MSYDSGICESAKRNEILMSLGNSVASSEGKAQRGAHAQHNCTTTAITQYFDSQCLSRLQTVSERTVVIALTK